MVKYRVYNFSTNIYTIAASQNRQKKEASLSPLSKRMALHAASLKKEEQHQQRPSKPPPGIGLGGPSTSFYNQPFYMAATGGFMEAPPPPNIINPFQQTTAPASIPVLSGEAKASYILKLKAYYVTKVNFSSASITIV